MMTNGRVRNDESYETCYCGFMPKPKASCGPDAPSASGFYGGFFGPVIDSEYEENRDRHYAHVNEDNKARKEFREAVKAKNIQAVEKHLKERSFYVLTTPPKFSGYIYPPERPVLHIAASLGRGSLEMVEILLAAGAPVNQKSPLNGNTALHEAAYWGKKDIFDMLIKYEADPSIKNKAGETAEQLAPDNFQSVMQDSSVKQANFC